MFKVIAFIILLLPNLIFGKTIDSFLKRFELVKHNKRLVEISDRSLQVNFKIRPYLIFIKNALKREQSLMRSKKDYELEIEKYFGDDMEMQNAGIERDKRFKVKLINDSMQALKNIDFDQVFSNKKFKIVINKFEEKISKEMNLGGFNILARPLNSKYFYKRNVTYQIVKWALELAKKTLSTVPVLNTASYVIVQVEKLVRERRSFHQNMLLHYFENFHESELGLEKSDVDLAVSSIYESKIPWYAFWESEIAVANWPSYGMNKFYTNVRAANGAWRENRTIFTGTTGKINFAFKETDYKKDRVIVNLFDQESMLKKRPAIAHYLDRPNFIKRKRIILQLAQLGISYLSLPDIVKSFAEKFLKSYYENQKITEGSLYGFFESNENQEGMKRIRDQYLNPFDRL